MKSIWGGSREDQSDDGSARNSLHAERDSAPPSEHTRLLPNRVESRPYLTPDDPAVSPYNLRSIRFTMIPYYNLHPDRLRMVDCHFGVDVRHATRFPHPRIGLLSLQLCEFGTCQPTLFAAILRSPREGFHQTRYEEGWVGMVSVLWAFVMAIWTLATDRLVEWGKYEEEERLTGRGETRRTLGEWVAVSVSTISMVIIAVVLFLMTCMLVLRALDAGLAAPGKMYWVDGDKYRLHVYCHGNHTDSKLPTVLIEGGEGSIEGDLWDFADNAVNNGSISRYCFVDRPGISWSDTAPSPLSAGMAVEAIDEALARAGEDGPWVLMSVGIGSIYSRILSSRHGKDVKGLLYEASHCGSEALSHHLELLKYLKLYLRAGPKKIASGGRSAYQTGKRIFAKLQENLVAGTLSKRDVASSRAIQAQDVPLTLVSSGVKIREDKKWEKQQRDLSHLTHKLRHWDIVDDAPHQVWETLEGREVIEKRLKQLVLVYDVMTELPRAAAVEGVGRGTTELYQWLKMASFFDIKARKAAAANGSTAKAGEPKQAARKQPWVEKYRPKTLSDVTAQDHTVNVLQRTLQASNLPHMLFYGPPGTGKTSTILALAKELYGPEMIKARVLELNASDERGISIVREKVKDFARMQLTNPPPGYRDRYPCPPFKIIILDEADSMTQDAQSALRRTMETYSKITRFCLICNYVTRIIDPLASRCSKFRFKSLDQGNARKRLEEIAEKEGVRLEDGAVDALIRCSEGDLRKAITFLQSAARLVGAVEKGEDEGEDKMDVDDDAGKVVSVKIVEDIAGVIPRSTVERLQKAMQPKSAGATYQAIAKVVEEMVADGWSAGQVVTQLYQAVINDELIPDLGKNKITLIFSEVDKRLVDGADEHLSILDLALRISNILAGKG
ncbi:hypothetical protein CIB48_g9050 [Xylaria polymorpha]|nr:hypothetical protein CIB48_g9050 [Xylaria polymorpha]